MVDEVNIFTPSAPVPDLDQSISSILRMVEFDTDIIYLSHYGFTRDVYNTFFKIIGQLLCWGHIIENGPREEAGGRLTAYVEKELGQWGSIRMAKEKGREDLIKWMKWRAGVMMVPGFQVFFNKKK